MSQEGWQRPIGCLKLQVIFRKRAIKYRALLRKMTYKDETSCGSSPPYTLHYTLKTHCNTLQHTAAHYNTLQHITTHCNTLQHAVTHYNTLQHITTCCNTLPHTAAHYNTLQHSTSHCNTLQHTAAHYTLHSTSTLSTS